MSISISAEMHCTHCAHCRKRLPVFQNWSEEMSHFCSRDCATDWILWYQGGFEWIACPGCGIEIPDVCSNREDGLCILCEEKLYQKPKRTP